MFTSIDNQLDMNEAGEIFAKFAETHSGEHCSRANALLAKLEAKKISGEEADDEANPGDAPPSNSV